MDELFFFVVLDHLFLNQIKLLYLFLIHFDKPLDVKIGGAGLLLYGFKSVNFVDMRVHLGSFCLFLVLDIDGRQVQFGVQLVAAHVEVEGP